MKLLVIGLYSLILANDCFANAKMDGTCRGMDETIIVTDRETLKLKGLKICSKDVPSRAVAVFKDKNADGILDKNDTVAYFISKNFQFFRNLLADKIDGFNEELEEHFKYSGKESAYYQIYIEDLIEMSNLENAHESVLNPEASKEDSDEMEQDISFSDLSVDDLYRQRYYDAETSRFLSPDPTGFASGDTNPYRYVGNNPINYVDPTGLDTVRLIVRLGKYIHSVLIVDNPKGGVTAIDYGPRGDFTWTGTVPGGVRVEDYPFHTIESLTKEYEVWTSSGVFKTTSAQDQEVINRAKQAQTGSTIPYNPFGLFGGKNCFGISSRICGNVCQ